MLRKITLLMIGTILFILSACGQEDNKYELIERDEDFTYYQKTKLNDQRHLYVFGRENDRLLNHHELVTGQAIQGIYAQDRVTFYLSQNDAYDQWLNYLKDNYEVTSETTTLEDMVLMYAQKYNDHGFILYDYDVNKESLNIATTLAGITGYIPINKTMQIWVESLGLELKMDVTEMSEREFFDQYKDELDNRAIIQLNTSIPHFRDYGVAMKYLYFYQDTFNNQAIQLRSDIHEWAKTDAPIFGWGPGTEDSHVGIASRNGQFTIPSDYSYNTTVFSAEEFSLDEIKQPNLKETIVAEDGKHYVTFVRSDGDNIQTWYNYFPFHDKDMGAQRGDFKFGWSIQPSLIDLAPHIVKHTYDNADENDYFVAAVSGFGYMYPSIYPDLKSYVSSLDLYMKKLDLAIVQILDSGPYDEVIEWYSQSDSIKGAMYMYGEKYMGGQGEIYWSENGKPFVSFRESVWDSILPDIATRVNQYDTDPTHIGGYSLINLHPWSHSYDDIKTIVNLFDDHVVVVSPEVFFDLIIENVERTNHRP